ncbi:MAG TPA: DUF6496 domain-containing protein [Bryobacteraceae bacterium]|jgi:hypothetical protein|nr:DUF6496 domain-containing protein [Bryobacteraceae bacterium]
MPEKRAAKKARAAKKRGNAPTTQASEYVREEMHEYKHGAKNAPQNPKQAIAIGLSRARKEGVNVPPAPGRRGRKASAKKSAAKKGAAKKTAAKKATAKRATTKKATARSAAKKSASKKTARKSAAKKSRR